MVDAALFDKLEAIARHFRQNPAPFGGIQVQSGTASTLTHSSLFFFFRLVDCHW
jgi:hypothetical protein